MATIVILQGHPDPEGGHLCHALADAYAAGALAGGHAVHRVEVAALDVPPLRSQAGFETAPPPESLVPVQAALAQAQHLVIVFPLWLGGMPAVLKAFLEQLLRPGFAFDYLPGGGTRMRLKGRSARVVVTMGMPALAFRLWYMGAGLAALTRGILGFVGFAPVRSTVLGSVGTAGEGSRRRWLKRMEDMGRGAR